MADCFEADMDEVGDNEAYPKVEELTVSCEALSLEMDHEIHNLIRPKSPLLPTPADRLLTSKATLAARVDLIRGDPSGRAELPKPLPVQDSELKKKKKKKKEKKRGVTEIYDAAYIRKLENRMQRGIPKEISLGDGLGEGQSVITVKVKVTKKYKEMLYGRSGATSGVTSSLAFMPVQGIEM